MWLKPIPKKDYYAVIFCSEKESELPSDYFELDEKLMNIAMQQKGFLGYESVHKNSIGIFISYWETLEDIEDWKNNALHLFAKQNAHNWYKKYLSQICKVEHTSIFNKL
jgi:heme-degrading monooxygenase HmoA